MSNTRGRRYEEKPKLNLKKVFAVIVAVVVIIMSIFGIKKILTKDSKQTKIVSKDYLVVFKDNKWGVIDSTNEVTIEPSYQEMIIIPNSKKDVFICTYDVNYENGEYKTKALNSKNEEILTQYEKIEAISNQDESGNIFYEDAMLKVTNGGKYGLINLDGEELKPCEYDEITTISGIKNIVKVKKDGKYGIIDSEGKEIIKSEYAEITSLGNDKNEGFIIKNEAGKCGIVNYSNQPVLEAKYDEITKIYGNNIYIVKQEGKQIVVDKQGKEILNSGFEEVKQVLKNTENGIIFTSGGKYGIMNLTGTVTIPPEYEELREAKTGLLIAKKDGKYGIIDMQNTSKVEFNYISMNYNEKADIYIAEKSDYSNDIIDNTFNIRQTGILIELNDEKGYIALRQNDEDQYYNLKFEEKNKTEIYTKNTLFKSKKDGKYGFVDKNGQVVVDYEYDDATEQNEYGYAGIKKDGKWGSINRDGEIVQEPTYNLDGYLKVDFIGRWHLGKDLNMNYYNQL